MSRRRNHTELLKLIYDALDEAMSPRWDKTQVARRFNQAYADWLRATCKMAAEKDEQARRDLGPLTFTKTVPIADSVLNLNRSVEDVYRTLAVVGIWERTVRNRTTNVSKLRTELWPIQPIRHDQLATATVDPWNKPADDDARYSESRPEEADGKPESLTVHSTTPPVRLSITYVKEPALVDFKKDPSAYTAVGYDIQLELVRRTVALLTTTDENYPAAQAQYQEIQVSH